MSIFNDTVKLQRVCFRGHLNLGGVSSKELIEQGNLTQIELLPNGSVRATRASGVFYVSAAMIEHCEAKIEVKPDLAPEKVEKPKISGKRAESGVTASVKSRADAILAEMGDKQA